MTIFEPKIIDAKEAVYQILRREYKRINEQFSNTELDLNVKVTTSYPLTEKNLDTGIIDPNNLFGGSQAQITISRVGSPTEEAFISDQLGPSGLVREGQLGNLPALPSQNGTKFLLAQGRLQHDIIEVRVWTLNAQFRDELYKLTQQVMFEQLPNFREEFGLWDTRKVSGMDSEVTAQWLPRTVFVATINYSILYPLMEIRSEDLVNSIAVSVSANHGVDYITVGTETTTMSS